MNARSRGVVPNLVIAFFTMLAPYGPAALAQSPAEQQRMEYERQQREYWRAQEAKRMEEHRRQQQYQEEQRRQREQHEAEKKRYLGAPSGGSYTPPSPSGDDSAEARRAVAEARATWEKQPPLPASLNPLLGKWQLQRASGAAQNSLLGMLANPGAITCPVLFGEGVLDFRETVLADAAGNAMDQVRYRGGGNRVAVLGTRGVQLMVFDFEGPSRIKSAFYDCVLLRMGPATTVAARAGAPAAAAAANAASATSARAAAGGGIANLGVNFGASIDAVRQSLAARQVSLLPARHNGNHYRLVADGEFSDIGGRIKRVAYEFDAPEGPAAKLSGVVITYTRDGGAQSVVYSERATAMSKQYPLTQQSPTQLQAAVPGAMVSLIDDANASAVYEVYRVR